MDRIAVFYEQWLLHGTWSFRNVSLVIAKEITQQIFEKQNGENDVVNLKPVHNRTYNYTIPNEKPF
jgi:hypothetical protein